MAVKKIVIASLKWIGITGVIFVLINLGYAIVNVFKVKKMSFEQDLVSVMNEKAFDMTQYPQKVSAVSMFSATTFDYRNTPVADEPYELEILAMYTGIEIIVPEGWFVESKGKIAMAGMDNSTLTYEDQAPQLKVHVDAKFAGIDISNIS